MDWRLTSKSARRFPILLLLALLGCRPLDDTGSGTDSGDTSETGNEDTGEDTGTDCEDLSALVAQCGDLVQPGEGGGTYYDGLDGNAAGLADALSLLIDDHTTVSYDNLWERFPATDSRADGTVWDVYSDLPGGEAAYIYTFSDQCGQYQGEGECFNREHLWPSNWFGGGSPMKSDLFHLVPTDGYVNNMRGSYAFGIVGEARWTSTNGSLRGISRQCGFARTVFEPIDAYKGDIARALLYFSVRYRHEGAAFDSSYATTGAHLEPWAEELLMAWHIQDPVDEKETDRNEAVFSIQGNRNPFIDHPEWACAVTDF
jgi:endonuclease I